ncbi:Protein NRT1/ PTR FAMILY 7.3 [Hibiscus syriacus]|uniref:Protein NRT1/ PTR FAMILY 7.3 n=1 Tax=Hibiscus syriacus TaxID=106335 RepID=A0A6A3B9Q2_HIBSY|nr:Protein NRT1/ PTR FAMILY 7.3 [Hibiscus syriacus]
MKEEQKEACTQDGAIDWHGRPAFKARSGQWTAGIIILLNQGLATLAFFGVGVNLVLFLTRVLGQSNADAANSVSKWTGTVYIFSLVGHFLSDSYWGRYKTCAIFQVIFVIGLVSLSLSSYIFLIRPRGCGHQEMPCGSQSGLEIALFYLSIYLVALGNGGYQPNIATFDPKEGHSKMKGCGYLDSGYLLPLLWEHYRYRHFRPSGNPLSRFSQVLVAATKKCNVHMPSDADSLYDVNANDPSINGNRKILHTDEFKLLDRAAYISTRDVDDQKKGVYIQWLLCPVTQVEEVKCILRLLPIWLCTIIYSVVFTQMASLFVEQGAAMNVTVSNFRIPPASMSSFDILSVALFIFLYRRVLDPLMSRLRKKDAGGLTELQRMGIGLVIAVLAMVSAGIVECYRLKYANKDCIHCEGSSSLSIFWQVPQYAFIGASEVFMYVSQLEFFNAQTPDGLKSFGSALCMTSISLGNYVSSLLMTMVMKISTEDHMPGWIPGNLNKGHLDRFYFLLAGMASVDLVIYILCARWYKCIKLEGKTTENDERGSFKV